MDYRIRQDIHEKLRGEIGTAFAPRHGNTAIALAYPNTYAVGMSNLGMQTIYGLLNERGGVCCERVFLPDAPLRLIYEQTNTPLCSLESQTPAADFDILAFSVSFENDDLNLLAMLELAHLPLKAEDRGERHPLVIVGGAITAINPEPLALFVDAFVIGDGEEILPQFLEMYQQCAAAPRRELLARLAQIPGVYVPSLYEVSYRADGALNAIRPLADAPAQIAPRPARDIDAFPAYSRILSEQTEFGDMFLLQITRGCPYKCRFCHTGYTQSPLRHLSFETAARLIERGLQFRRKIGLVSPAVADYPDFERLCDFILARGAGVTVSSLRISACSRDGLLERLARAGQRTITLAPEAGTARLRKILRKNLPNEMLYATIERIRQTGIPNVKLYFLIGVPTETETDIEGIIEVCGRCRDILAQDAKRRGKIGTLTVSVNPFVPKPFTPLQWCGMATEKALKQKLQQLSRALGRLGNAHLIAETPKWAIWQGILARGDRRLGEVLLRANAFRGDWKKAFRDAALTPEWYAHRERGADEAFPWNHLQIGLSQPQLREEYQQIIQGIGSGADEPPRC